MTVFGREKKLMWGLQNQGLFELEGVQGKHIQGYLKTIGWIKFLLTFFPVPEKTLEAKKSREPTRVRWERQGNHIFEPAPPES